MLTDVQLYIGYESARSNEGRILLDSLRSHLDAIGQPGADNAEEIRAVADVSLTLLDAALAFSERLGKYIEPDGKGGHRTIYRPIETSISHNLQTGVEEGRTA